VHVRDGRVVRLDGDWSSPVSAGLLCRAGRFDPLAETRERLLTPLVRHNGELEPATWDEALSVAARGLPGAAGIISTRLPVEALAAYQQLMEVGLHSPLITSIEEGRTTSAQVETSEASLDDLRAADLVILWGADVERSHQVAGFFVKRKLPGGLGLIVVDPRETPLSARAGLVLRPAAGADGLLLRAWLAALAPGTNGFDPAHLAAQAGVPAETVKALAHRVAAAQRPVVVYGKGLTAHQPEALALLRSVAKTTGHVRLLCLRGEANSRSAECLQLTRPFTPAGPQPVFVVLGDDFASGRLLEGVKDASFVVVAATHRSPLTEQADVVLPVEGWLEQTGHYLNLEGRLQAAQGALAAPTGVRSNAAMLAGLAEVLGLRLVDDWRARLGLQPAAADNLCWR
jgi:formate dehydrogenase major subunit